MLRPGGVPAHAVDEECGEPVGELICLRTGSQPRIRPVRRGEREERGCRVIEIGTQLAELAAFSEERAEPLLVAAALGDEAIAPLAFEVAPLAREDGGDIELLGDDAQVRTERCADPLDDRAVVGDGVERAVERLRPFARDLPEEVRLRLDVGVERPLLDAERVGEVADRGAVVALLGEEPGGGAG